jgi:hypothetical protein
MHYAEQPSGTATMGNDPSKKYLWWTFHDFHNAGTTLVPPIQAALGKVVKSKINRFFAGHYAKKAYLIDKASVICITC